MSVSIVAYVGIGGWIATGRAKLIACPHVGDSIEVQGQTVTCDHVHITAKDVVVRQTVRFASHDEAKAFFQE